MSSFVAPKEGSEDLSPAKKLLSLCVQNSSPIAFASLNAPSLSQSLPLPLPFTHPFYPHIVSNGNPDSLAKTFDPRYSELAPLGSSFNAASPPFPMRRDSYPTIFHLQMSSDTDQNINDTRLPRTFDYEFYRSATASSISSSRRPSEASVDTSANSISLPASYNSPTAAIPPLPFFFRNEFFQFPFSVPEYSSEIFAPKSDFLRKETDQTTLFSSSVPNVLLEPKSSGGKQKVLKSKKHRKAGSVDLTRNSSDNEEEETKDAKSAKPSPFSCNECGKIYKHGSCLSKHKWEHTELWQETTRLSLSKHQQVQILEAASILVTLGNENSEDDVSHSKDDGFPLDGVYSAKEIEVVSDTAAAALAMVSMSEKFGSTPANNAKSIEVRIEHQFDEDGDIEIDIENLSPNPEDDENFEIEIDNDDYEMQGMMMEMEIGDMI
ncbi:hypothetical protein HK096_005540 [Nowakowskiella sp. JEL0078]|nr:hypothetical protein HK096_005540 [Nowakowskiella sp. JEL0078]